MAHEEPNHDELDRDEPKELHKHVMSRIRKLREFNTAMREFGGDFCILDRVSEASSHEVYGSNGLPSISDGSLYKVLYKDWERRFASHDCLLHRNVVLLS
jgi:hypothetical protein